MFSLVYNTAVNSNKKRDMINILYIHGYGSDAKSTTGQKIRKNLPKNFKVITHSFSNNYEQFEAMSDNIQKARELIEANKIDLVVASSMGAFIAMSCTDIPKILINPCMLPSEQLKLRIAPTITDEELNKYRDYETSLIANDSESLLTYGLFSTHDELFSYKTLFESRYSADKVYIMNDEHRISATSIQNELIPLIRKIVCD